MTYRVLVTGADAPAGRSMIDALADEPVMLLACDCRLPVNAVPDARCFDVHKSDHREFVGDVLTLCAVHHVDVVVPARASDQEALAPLRRLFEELGACMWLEPIPEHATRSQARRIVQLGANNRGRWTMGTWIKRLSNLGLPAQ